MIVVIVNNNSRNLLYIVMEVMMARNSAVTINNSDRSLLHGVGLFCAMTVKGIRIQVINQAVTTSP